MRRALLVRVWGIVQGVGYRAWTERQATALGLTGWVRNRRDGSVEALIAGEGTAVDSLLLRFSEGPPGCDVEGVESSEAEVPQSVGFSVLPTA